MTNAASQLHQLWQKGTSFLGSRYGILGGAMTWVSDRYLVSAISNAGGFGVIASGSMPPKLLEEEIRQTFSLTNKPFGVNLITMHPQLIDLIQVCIDMKVSHVVLAGGIPHSSTIDILKKAKVKVICFAPSLKFAKRLIRIGADALVLEGAEAGGHIGPVSTSVLAQEILPHIETIPVFIAGGIGRGEAIVSYLEMGASGCQLGTRFVCTHESTVHPDFKKAFIRANARDAILSPQLDPRFPVIPVRALRNDASDAFLQRQREVITRFDDKSLSLKEAQLEIEHFWTGALRRAVKEGDMTGGSLMAGQSVGMVTREQSTKDVIDELISQATLALESRSSYRLQAAS